MYFQSLGLFGAKTQTTSAPSSGFGFGTTTVANNNAPKPLTLFGNTAGSTTSFGTPGATNFGTGTGGLFSTQTPQQNKSFSFSGGFGAQQPFAATSFGKNCLLSYHLLYVYTVYCLQY